MIKIRTHKVKRGDSLWGVAKKYLGDGNRYTEIMKLNGMTDTVIQPGMVLRIPIEKDYEKIGMAFEKAMKDIEDVDSIDRLFELLGD